MRNDENRKSKQDIAGPHVGGGQGRFGEPVKQGGDGLRGQDPQTSDDLVDQDTPGKHEPAAQPRAVTNRRPPEQDAQHGADVRGEIVSSGELADQAPEGVWRERKGPMNKSTGRHSTLQQNTGQ